MAFKIGHEHYTTKGDFKKDHKPWNKQKRIELNCLYCGKTFLVSKSRRKRKYCSKDCDPRWANNKPEKIRCDICGKRCGGEQGLKAHKLAVHTNSKLMEVEK